MRADELLNVISSAVGSLTNPTKIADSFAKIVVVKDDILPWTDDRGVRYINIEDFLLGEINRLSE